MLTLDRKLRPHPDAVDTELDRNEMVLLHLGSKTYYSLNATGVRIWQCLKKGLSLREISRSLQNEFQVDEETAERCVVELVQDLADQKLVEIVE